jgi:hypothetical protein
LRIGGFHHEGRVFHRRDAEYAESEDFLVKISFLGALCASAVIPSLIVLNDRESLLAWNLELLNLEPRSGNDRLERRINIDR